jgi:hypothetical protein
MAAEIEENILLDTSVDLIDWRGPQSLRTFLRRRKRPIQVRATSGDGTTCYRIRAKKVLVTTSVGVTDARGDCLRSTGSRDDCNPRDSDNKAMYNPPLPRSKMTALRDIYVDEELNTPTIGTYKDIRFQFGTNFWGGNSTTEEIILTANDKGRGYAFG